MSTCPTCGARTTDSAAGEPTGREKALAEARKRFGTPTTAVTAGAEIYRQRSTGATFQPGGDAA